MMKISDKPVLSSDVETANVSMSLRKTAKDKELMAGRKASSTGEEPPPPYLSPSLSAVLSMVDSSRVSSPSLSALSPSSSSSSSEEDEEEEDTEEEEPSEDEERLSSSLSALRASSEGENIIIIIMINMVTM